MRPFTSVFAKVFWDIAFLIGFLPKTRFLGKELFCTVNTDSVNPRFKPKSVELLTIPRAIPCLKMLDHFKSAFLTSSVRISSCKIECPFRGDTARTMGNAL